jgi:hypothetical protein
LRALATEREPYYRETADFVVDVAGLSPFDVADVVASLVRPGVGASGRVDGGAPA